jgi:phosphopantetheinyl transferase (holo-ACP synthase)
MHGRAEARFLELGATRAHVSLTHSGSTAVAVVVLEG